MNDLYKKEGWKEKNRIKRQNRKRLKKIEKEHGIGVLFMY